MQKGIGVNWRIQDQSGQKNFQPFAKFLLQHTEGFAVRESDLPNALRRRDDEQ
jgi:hypothetical protein